MSKQHEKVKTLRYLKESLANGPVSRETLDWAIGVCEAADKLVNVKGKSHSEVAYRNLEAAVNQ